MRQATNNRATAVLQVGYLEWLEVYRFRCDDPDLDCDIERLQAGSVEEAKDQQRKLIIALEKLGRSVEVQHDFVPDLCDDDKPGPDGKYRLRSIRCKLF